MSTPSSIAAITSQNIQGTKVVEATPAPLVLQMIPSAHHYQGRDQEQIQLATTMRSLVLDHKHPIALEIAGTDQQRCLLIRARNQDDLHHVETQLQARLSHATFVPLAGHDDPFHLSAGETASVVELHAGQASYLPLQEFERMTRVPITSVDIVAASKHFLYYASYGSDSQAPQLAVVDFNGHLLQTLPITSVSHTVTVDENDHVFVPLDGGRVAVFEEAHLYHSPDTSFVFGDTSPSSNSQKELVHA